MKMEEWKSKDSAWLGLCTFLFVPACTTEEHPFYYGVHPAADAGYFCF